MTTTLSPLRDLSLADLRRRTSVKWRMYPEDVLPLWVAEMDVHLAEPIADALRDAIATGDTGYPYGTAYAEALIDFCDDHWGWRPAIEHTSNVADVMQGISHLLDVLTDPGDAVVITPPVYPPFTAFVQHAGRRIVDAPLTLDGRLDPTALDRAFGEAVAGGRRAVLLLSSPHNPTGTVHTPEELIAVTEIATAHGVRVVVDEIHAPLELPGASHVPYLSLPGTERAFSLMSASKAWNLAGLKGAVAIAGPEAADDLAKMPREVRNATHFGVIAHTAAFRYGGPWLTALLADLADNRRLLGELLATHLPTVGWRPLAATYLTWLDCRALGLGDDPAAVFLERGRVAVNPGPTFGVGGAGHVRLNIATTPAILTEAVERIASVL
jgi:cystathionine beta-lyase